MSGPSPAQTVLLAEDDDVLRHLLTTVLRRQGYEVIAASDGQQALGLANARNGAIDLLLSDVQMPHMTGPDLARTLRLSRPDLRVLLISAFPQGLLMLDSGWVFLQKPFRPDAIVQKVRDVMAAAPGPADHG